MESKELETRLKRGTTMAQELTTNATATAIVPVVEPAVEETKTETKTPLLDKWQTSAGYSILGAFSAYAVACLCASFPGGIIISLLVGLILPFVYIVQHYPSYFGATPKSTSCEFISFANFFVSCMALGLFGTIFGALWNYNLTKGEKGISHIVLVVIICLVVLMAAYVTVPYL